jgi:hypothetical protein
MTRDEMIDMRRDNKTGESERREWKMYIPVYPMDHIKFESNTSANNSKKLPL